jgi:hypothetical protein
VSLQGVDVGVTLELIPCVCVRRLHSVSSNVHVGLVCGTPSKSFDQVYLSERLFTLFYLHTPSNSFPSSPSTPNTAAVQQRRHIQRISNFRDVNSSVAICFARFARCRGTDTRSSKFDNAPDRGGLPWGSCLNSSLTEAKANCKCVWCPSPHLSKHRQGINRNDNDMVCFIVTMGLQTAPPSPKKRQPVALSPPSPPVLPSQPTVIFNITVHDVLSDGACCPSSLLQSLRHLFFLVPSSIVYQRFTRHLRSARCVDRGSALCKQRPPWS